MVFNRGQRVVAVIALGIGLWLGWTALDAATGSAGGWFNYAPDNGVIYSDTRSALQTNEWLRLGVQLCFLGVWLVGSAWLLAERQARRIPPGSADTDTDTDSGA